MRILLLGGTAWFSREIATAAVARGHEVVCAARGGSGGIAAGATLVRADRDEPEALAPLADQRWDAVVDVTRRPSHARSAVAALAHAAPYWLYVSTISVYADHATPRQDTSAPTVQPAGEDLDEQDTADYDRLKRACEVAVTDALPDRSMLIRPGLIVGPGDPSGRFAYWVHHAAASSDLLVPGEPEDAVQWVDVRDLAAWTVDLVEQRRTGVLDGVGPPRPRVEFVQDILAGTGSAARTVWVDQDFLAEHDVRMWMGARSIPLWVPLPDHAGHMDRDPSTALSAGLAPRPLADTARDTLRWLRTDPAAALTGLTDAEHAELLSRAASRRSTPS